MRAGIDTPRAPSRAHARRRAAAALVGGGVLLAAVLSWPRERASLSAALAPAASEASASVSPSRFVGAGAPAATPPAPPVIDAIDVEKSEVCAGEENLVSVKAHAVDGHGDLLHYVIAGKPGAQVPVRASAHDDGEWPRVIVYGKDGATSVREIPRFTVKDCKAPHLALVSHHLRANTSAEFEYTVRVLDAGDAARAHAARPIAYRWTFADGTTEATSFASVVHGFEQRPQDTMYSTLLTRVDVELDDGDKVVARDTIELVNPAFETLAKKGIVMLLTQLTPRFATMGADGTVTQKVRVWHTRKSSVSVRQVLVRYLKDDSAGASGGAASHADVEKLDARDVLGTAVIEPGRGIEVTVRFDSRGHAGAIGVDYQLVGVDADGSEAGGSFSVLTPPPVPDATNSVAVTDAALKARIHAAQRILNQRSVTQEDLDRLEREGRFADLPRK